MSPFVVACLVLLVLWFLVGVVPVGSMQGFPKRNPVVFVLVAVLLLGFVILFSRLSI